MNNSNYNFISKLRVLLLLLACFLCFSASAETETIDLSSGVLANGEMKWDATSCSIVQTKGNSSSSVKDFGSTPRWYKENKVYFSSKKGCQLSEVTLTCETKDYATNLNNSTFSSNVTYHYSQIKKVVIQTNGDFEIDLGGLSYITSISVTYVRTDVPKVTTSTSSLDFGISEINTTQTKNFTLSAINLTSDISLTLTGDDANSFEFTPKNISEVDGEVKSTEISVIYTPTTTGSHTAYLLINSGDMTLFTVTLTGKVAVKHNVTWSVNGKMYEEGTPTLKVADGDRVEVLPQTPNSIGDNQFVGWTTNPIQTEQTAKPSVLFTTAADAPIVTADVTYYAVYSTKGAGTSWTKHSVADISEGIYAITNDEGNVFTGKISSGRGTLTSDAFAFDDANVSSTSPQNICEITIVKSETAEGYLLYNASNGYLYAKDAKAGNLDWQTSENSYWIYDETKATLKYSSNNAILRIGTNNNTPCLNTYGTNSGKPIFLVKKESVGSYKTTIDETTTSEVYEPKAYKFVAHNASGYWATMSHAQPLFIPSDITTSTVVVDNNQLTIDDAAFGQPTTVMIDGNEVTGVYVPANTGVLLSSVKQDATYYVVTNKSISSLSAEANMLKAAPVGGGVFADDSDYMFYKLSYDNAAEQTGLGFYWGADEGGVFNIKANTAYLAVPTAKANNAKSFVLDGFTTSIANFASPATKQSVYNVSGMKVQSASRPGFYIVGGKKIVRR